MDFAVTDDHRVKLKESEKRDKYLNLVRELKKKLWNMKVTAIPILTGALCTITKGLVQELEDLEIKKRIEAIQTTALLRLARIFIRVQELDETCCNSNFFEKPSANTGVKKKHNNKW